VDFKLRQFTLASFALGCCVADSSRAEVRLQERTEFFDIGFVSGDPDQLWKGLQRNGPVTHTGVIVGTTKSNISLSRTIQTTTAGCFVKSADVNLTLLVTLPAWSWRNSAPADHQAYWDCVERTVTVHENRHVGIWKETAQRIDTALNGMTVVQPCAELNARIGEVFGRLMQEGRSRQTAFDADDQKRQRYEKCMPVRSVEPRAAANPKPGQQAAGSAVKSGPDVRKPAAAVPLAVADPQDHPDLGTGPFDGAVGTIIAIILSAVAMAAFGLAAIRHVAAKAVNRE
jgi:predicted secreted Zn-dependent protease